MFVCSKHSQVMSSKKTRSSLNQALDAMGMGITHQRMRQNQLCPHSAPYRRNTDNLSINDPIKSYEVWPGLDKPEEDCTYVKLDKSYKALVTDNLEELEANFLKHTFGASSYISEAEGKRSRMLKYFKDDPFGLKDISESDTNCWTAVTVTNSPDATAAGASSKGASKKKSKSPKSSKARSSKDSGKEPEEDQAVSKTRKKMVITGFYRDLKEIQKKYYMHLRASIVRYMDEPAKNFYKTKMA